MAARVRLGSFGTPGRSALPGAVALVLSIGLLPSPAGAIEAALGHRGFVVGAGRSFAMRLGGRLHLDQLRANTELTEVPNERDIRRLRAYMRLSWRGTWDFKAERDFQSKSWKSVKLRWRPIRPLSFTVGNQEPLFGLQVATGSNNAVFQEAALPGAFTPGSFVGLSFHHGSRRGTLSGGYYLDTLGGGAKKRATGDGVVGRTTWAPVLRRRGLLHLGASGEYRRVDPGVRYRIRTRPESGIANPRLVDTRTIDDVESTITVGTELAWVLDSVAFQAEWMGTRLRRTGRQSNLHGMYGQASWFVTGETRPYSSRRGAFRRVRPNLGFGALELAVRLSHLDLEDDDIDGGVERNVTTAVNWYAGRNLRLAMNFIRVYARPNRNGDTETMSLLQGRLLIAF